MKIFLCFLNCKNSWICDKLKKKQHRYLPKSNHFRFKIDKENKYTVYAIPWTVQYESPLKAHSVSYKYCKNVISVEVIRYDRRLPRWKLFLKFAFDTERYNKEIRNSFRWAIKRQGGKKGFVAMKIVLKA